MRHFNYNYLFILGFSFCAACAPFNSGSSLEQRVEQQDIQLRQMQPQQADTWNQVQAMREEINSLKAQLNDLNNAGGAKALADRVRQHDEALRQVDSSMSLDLELGSPMAARSPASDPLQPVAPATAPESTAYAAPAQPVPAPASDNYGLPPEQPRNTDYQPAQAPSESTWGQADPKPVAPEPKKDISQALFEAGVNAFNARNYAEAQKSFSDFIKNFPSNAKAAEAQFYLAECQFNQNHFPEAALAYDTVINKYPKSSSAPAAFLKQGICFGKMKNPDAAKARMQTVISRFPKSPEAARAKAYLKTNK